MSNSFVTSALDSEKTQCRVCSKGFESLLLDVRILEIPDQFTILNASCAIGLQIKDPRFVDSG